MDGALIGEEIDGVARTLRFDARTTREVALPLLARWTGMRAQKGARLVVMLGGVPAAGKSAFAAYLARLSRSRPEFSPVQALGLDGFHYPLDYMAAHTVLRDGREVPMNAVKGCPETFDVEAFAAAAAALGRGGAQRWPFYDRRTHDVVPDAVAVTGEIAVVEGLWLLLDEPAWRAAAAPADFRMLLCADAEFVRARSVARKARGGLAPRAAEAFFEYSDRPNFTRILERLADADVYLCETADGAIGMLPDKRAAQALAGIGLPL